MLEPDGSPNTAHSLNQVPVIVTVDGVTLEHGGVLADVAPTVLELLGIEQPEAMTGRSLLGGLGRWPRRPTTPSTASTACPARSSWASATRWPSSCAPTAAATRRRRSRRCAKPTVAAWAANQAVRSQKRAARELWKAGDALSAAQDAVLAGKGSGAKLREASERERAAVETLVDAARGLLGASGGDLSEATIERVRETLHAGAIDSDARDEVAAGPRRPRALAAGPLRGRPLRGAGAEARREGRARAEGQAGAKPKAQGEAQGHVGRTPPSASASARRRPSASARRPRPASASARRPPRASASARPPPTAPTRRSAPSSRRRSARPRRPSASRRPRRASARRPRRWTPPAPSSTRSSAADLRSRFLEGVGDRVLEAQRAAFARGGVPCVGPAARAGGLEERRVEPGLDRILGLCRSGARRRRRRASRRARRRRRTTATAARPRRPSNATGRTTMLAAERELLAERVRGGVGLTGQQRGQAEVAAVDHPGRTDCPARARSGSRGRRSPSRHDRCRGRARRRPRR